MRSWRSTVAVMGAVLGLLLVPESAFAGKLKRLSEVELTHYEALKVWFGEGGGGSLCSGV